jgi:hypothetical protein
VSEMTDLVMPVLEEIQAELAGVSDLRADLRDIKTMLLDSREATERLNGYMQVAFGQLGLNAADIEIIRGELKAMDARVRRLEP